MAVVPRGLLERRAVADPKRRGRGPVAGERVDTPRVLRPVALERLPRLRLRAQRVTGPLQPGARLAVFVQLDPRLVPIRQPEVEDQVLDAVPAHRAGEL